MHTLINEMLNFKIPILNKTLSFKDIRTIPKEYHNEIQVFKDKVILFTDYLPDAFSLSQRIKFLINNKNKNNFRCPCCKEPLKYNLGKKEFMLTCGINDQPHQIYVYNHISKTRETTNLKKYGTKAYTSTQEFKNKTKDTILKKYGVENVFSSKKIQSQIRDTTFNKYGVKYHNQKNMILNNLNNESLKGFLSPDNTLLINKVKETFICSLDTIYRRMQKLGNPYTKLKGRSHQEKIIIDFIKILDPDTKIIINSRKIIAPKELDIYLPEYHLAIEYNGLMFHSQGVSKFPMFHKPNLDKNMHKLKTDVCQDKDIQLLHIQDNEWLTPQLQEIWKSVLRNKMHKNHNRVGARQCSIEKIQTIEAGIFLNKNHLQGAGAVGKYKYGLYYNNELVALMSFGAARFSDTDYELIRFAVKQNWTVMGAASKLLEAFRKEHKGSIISYANRRWSDGNLYRRLGFQELHTSPPNFYVFHPNNIFKLWHRASFQKHKLPAKFTNFKDDQTAEWNLFQNGYRKIYDSGNYVFKIDS